MSFPKDGFGIHPIIFAVIFGPFALLAVAVSVGWLIENGPWMP